MKSIKSPRSQDPAVLFFKRQEQLFLNPVLDLQRDIDEIYTQENYEVGWPMGARRIFEDVARPDTSIVVGLELGDEGKGRIVDNKLQFLLARLDTVYVDRYQGGNNAGHTVEKKGTRLALHLVPSGVMHDQAIGIMDQGMVINPDLQDEVDYVEKVVGDTRGKLILSQKAILSTDLERAEELLNRIKQRNAAGGTGRGIGPAYAHHYDRLGSHVDDLIGDDWQEKFSRRYDNYDKEFKVYDLDLAAMDVPDFAATKAEKKAQIRTVGAKAEYLDRLEKFRAWLIKRGMVKNVYLIHEEIYGDLSKGVLFEGAQALGLHPWLGTRPDVTSSDTSVLGVSAGTGFWKPANILDKTGVFKITYTSSVGVRKMPTEVELKEKISKPEDLPADATPEQQWAAFVRDKAREFGTTTGRPRDILYIDLEFLRYNCRMAGIEVLAGTHLDIAREGESIKVCTHYTNKMGEVVPYQPGLQFQKEVIPQFVELPGWDGEAVEKTKSFADLPENAKKFLAFIQKRTGYPIVIATTGPDRENYMEITAS